MSISIVFDNPSSIYNPGDTITGRAILVSKGPVTVKGIFITVDGRAHTEWRETRGTGEHSETIQITGDQNLLFNTVSICGDQLKTFLCSPKSILPAGRHEFSFSFPLPTDLPGSYYSGDFAIFGMEYGSIVYSIRAHIETSTFKFDIKTEEFFRVNPVHVLGPGAALAEETQSGKDICCWCCAAGRVGVIVSLSKSGYVNGEAIVATVNIINHSRKSINEMTMSLVQYIKFVGQSWRLFGGGHTRWNQKTMDESIQDGRIKPGETQQWVNEVRVPSVDLAYPTLLHPVCSIINVWYSVNVEIHIAGCTRNLVVLMPVIIGTVPVTAG